MKQKYIDNKTFLTGFALVLGISGAAYIFVTAENLQHTAILFVGIASVLAVGLSILPRTPNESATSTITIGMLMALVASMVVFHEGLVCILMAAPLFLSIGVSVGEAIDKSNNKRRMRVWLVLILLPLSTEGVTEEWSFDRHETVTLNRVVALTPEQVELKLAQPPDLSQMLPLFLQLGFPVAQHYSSDGLNVGAQRCFHVPARKNLSGNVCWNLEERSASHVLFRLVKDESKISHWMRWQTARVAWSAAGEGQTRVTVTLKFWRKLDPAWYFGPLQRYAVGLTGDYLIGAYFGDE